MLNLDVVKLCSKIENASTEVQNQVKQFFNKLA